MPRKGNGGVDDAAGRLHLVKMAVGAADVEELRRFRAQRYAERGVSWVYTRNHPRRTEAVLDGGSLYWVVKGQIAVRQRLLALKPVVRQGVPCCGLVYDPELIATVRRHRDPFQGWRYLDPKDAPPDARDLKGLNLPEALKIELAELGLL